MNNLIPVFFLIFLLSATASELPFLETFEVADDVVKGSIDGQNGWVLDGDKADVRSPPFVQDGSQAFEIMGAEVVHDLSSNNSALWLHFQVRCAEAPMANPTITDSNTSLAFFVNTSRNLVVYSNTVPVELAVQMPLNDWTRFDIYCDYDDQYWDLSMDGINVAAGLPLYSTNNQLAALVIGNESASSVYVDQIDVADTEQTAGDLPDSDSDEIPDWWEQKNFDGPTSVVAGNLSENGGLTYLETYVAGVSPFVYDPFVVELVPGGNGMTWTSVESRLYSVYWTSNLTNAFAWLEDLPYPQSEFIDNAHGDEPAGFYRLKVQVQ